MIHYNNATEPPAVGIYACRVGANPESMGHDKFLFWTGVEWMYRNSPQPFPLCVFGWIGPLERKHGPAFRRKA